MRASDGLTQHLEDQLYESQKDVKVGTDLNGEDVRINYCVLGAQNGPHCTLNGCGAMSEASICYSFQMLSTLHL